MLEDIQSLNLVKSMKKTVSFLHENFENNVFIRRYSNGITACASLHMHHTNNTNSIKEYKKFINDQLKKLPQGSIVLLEGKVGMDTSKKESYENEIPHLVEHMNRSESFYTFLRVLKLKKDNDIDALFVEPKLTTQIKFMLKRNTPAHLLYSFLVLNSLSKVFNNFSDDKNENMAQKMSRITSVDDFIEESLKPIKVKNNDTLTPINRYDLDTIEYVATYETFPFLYIQKDHFKQTQDLLKLAFRIAKHEFGEDCIQKIINDRVEATNLTAPIHSGNLFKEGECDASELQKTTNTILNESSQYFEDFYQATEFFEENFSSVSKFNVISSMLNVIREQGLKDHVESFRREKHVFILYGSNHVQTLHQYFLTLN